MSKASPSFKLDGKPWDENDTSSPLLKKIIEYLEKLPSGEYLSMDSLAEQIGSTPKSIQDYTSRKILADHKFLVSRPRRMLFWSSKKNIEVLRRHLSHETE